MPHKIYRKRFCYGGLSFDKPGLTITNKCINCGKCKKACSFDAIFKEETQYKIDGNRCDECGSCYLVCPASAVIHKGN